MKHENDRLVCGGVVYRDGLTVGLHKGIQSPDSPSEGEPGKFECGVIRKSQTPLIWKYEWWFQRPP
jgi:hypothetical protein